MIRSAAPQHSVPIEGLIAALSRKPNMKIKVPLVVRAYGAVKAGLALLLALLHK
jgi:hypothetical protein